MPTFGAYKSVNNLPHFANEVTANGGPFDPANRVTIRLSKDGRYTINGVDTFDDSMKPQYRLDLKRFVNNTINGVRYVSNGVLQIDADGVRYITYISDAGEDNYLPYSVSIQYSDSSLSYYITTFELPGDHPFLQAFKPSILNGA